MESDRLSTLGGVVQGLTLAESLLGSVARGVVTWGGNPSDSGKYTYDLKWGDRLGWGRCWGGGWLGLLRLVDELDGRSAAEHLGDARRDDGLGRFPLSWRGWATEAGEDEMLSRTEAHGGNGALGDSWTNVLKV